MNQTGAAVRAIGLGKAYRSYAGALSRLREWLDGRSRHELIWALREVAFELAPGAALGVVGDNGAGKTTLLSLIAGAAAATSGAIEVVGTRSAILELGAGFHRDFTGRENLWLAGLAMGIERNVLRRREGEIIEFAELGEAIDAPLRTWSSGMVLRLAFATATAVEPDVLIVDEALAVGDQRFQSRCLDRIDAFRRRGGTLIFCSHNLYQVKKLCDSALWLEKGRPRLFGPAAMVVDGYADASRERRLEDALGRGGVEPPGEALRLAQVARVEAFGPEGEKLRQVETGASITLRVWIEPSPLADLAPGVAIGLVRSDGLVCHCTSTEIDGVELERDAEGRFAIELQFPCLPLLGGRYHFNVAAIDNRRPLVLLDVREGEAPFSVVNPLTDWGVSRLAHAWQPLLRPPAPERE